MVLSTQENRNTDLDIEATKHAFFVQMQPRPLNGEGSI